MNNGMLPKEWLYGRHLRKGKSVRTLKPPWRGSWTWHGFGWACNKLNKQIEWKIGNEELIKLWVDPWDETILIQSIRGEDFSHMGYQSSIYLADAKKNLGIVRGANDNIVGKLEPVALNNIADQLVSNSARLKSLKSVDVLEYIRFSQAADQWRMKVWNSKAPAKANWTLYVACQNKLLTQVKIKHHGIVIPSRCYLCSKVEETNKHLLIDCHVAQRVWKETVCKFGKIRVPWQDPSLGSRVLHVTGFSVGGRVVDGNGVGVEGVKISLDGQERSLTDNLGRYKLDQVTSRHYTISAEKEHYKFKILDNLLVLPNMASVPDVEATEFDVCGTIKLINHNYKAKAALTHGPENTKPQVKHIDENGRFCFMVPPGEFLLSAIAATLEDVPNLQFLPPYVDIIVKNPVLHIEFSQAQVNILGAVICKEQCSNSVFVSLTSLLSKEIRTVALRDGSSEFVFPNVLPGKYLLRVKHESSHPTLTKEDNWCWEQDTIEVDVGTEDKEGVVFVQKGFWVDIISTHDVGAHILSPEEPPISFLIKKGPQRICIQSHGLHELHLGDSCIFFGNATLKFDTSNPTPIVLSGHKYLVNGAILFNAKSVNDSKELAERVMVDVYDRNDQVLDTINVNLMHDENGSKDSILYEYSAWANYGDELVFVPRDSGGIQERKFLFYPRTQQLAVVTDGCQAPVAPFDGRLGIYIEGSISPPIPGVHIKVISLGESQNAQLQKGDLVLETETGSDGFFSGGPLYDDTSYTVEASKHGYHLKPVGHYSFACQKLSQINVKIYSGEELAVHFPPVLLSLSGEDGYRNNSVTNSGGIFSFEDLFPGSFYLRPLLKEYSFSPAAQAIDLGLGEFKEIIFHATRVAYSATGTVSLLSGQPKEGILVEARSPSKGYYEESTTDPFGHFRLRGLIPNTTYFLKVVSKEDSGTRIERASPDSVTIEVGSEDIKDVDFVVFEEPEKTILSGHVEGIDLINLQPHITVQIRSANDPSKTVAALPLPLSHYFQVRDLPKSKHFVQLLFSHSSNTRKFESEILEVDLTIQPQIHVGPLKYKVLELHHKLEPTPAPVFPLIVGVCIIALFISMPRLRDILNWASNSATSASLAFVTKKETKKPVTRKRAY